MPERRYRWLHYAFNSLLGEVLLWIFSLLLFLWALSVVMTYQVASSIANKPYDETLSNEVMALSKLLSFDGQRVKLDLPGAASELLHTDAKDKVYFQVTGPNGERVAGEAELPWIDAPEDGEAGVRFRDDEVAGEDLRVAYQFVALPGAHRPVLVQVAETRHKRQGLAASIVSGVIVPQFVIVPVAVLLVYLGLTQGITPLQRLQRELGQRRPADLSPISVNGLPEEIRPLIESMNAVMKRLDDNLLAQRRFIADAAHQLKTPLTGLRTQTDLALGETDAEALRRALRYVAKGTERMSHLTQQLLSLARVEATSEQPGQFAEVDLAALARAVTAEAADRALVKAINLGFEDSGMPVPVIGSEFLLREMIANLIDNAIKYTPPQGEISVRVIGRSTICLEIDDSGCGIPVGERDRVFERFYRVIGTDAEGSGLGLAIVREVAEIHGGKVEIGTSPLGGARLRVSLPRAAAASDR
ncbi:MAG: sensor histidine kinase N-terminal domain-containing protein [Rhodocyclaceae bacterium]|nr:sensor histidine kinase N-terminal domain-containing protein [Rhodocyclaceae bacterium]